MFDAVRNNKKIVQGILALIILPFAFWGVESYVSGVGPGNDVATVGESKISTYQFEQAWREQMDRMRQQLVRISNRNCLIRQKHAWRLSIHWLINAC